MKDDIAPSMERGEGALCGSGFVFCGYGEGGALVVKRSGGGWKVCNIYPLQSCDIDVPIAY